MTGTNTATKPKGRFCCLFIIFAILGVLFLGMYGCATVTYSEGTRVGVVTKFSSKGVFFKTWEGELSILGTTTNEQGVLIPNVWPFSVNDEASVAAVQSAMRSGRRVELHYKQKYMTLPWRGDTTYLITKVDALEPERK
jgi:hypothetical protein